jgi:hypothetical protein
LQFYSLPRERERERGREGERERKKKKEREREIERVERGMQLGWRKVVVHRKQQPGLPDVKKMPQCCCFFVFC